MLLLSSYWKHSLVKSHEYLFSLNIRISLYITSCWIAVTAGIKKHKCELLTARSAFHPSPCKGSWGRSRKTGHFGSLHSCNSPAAAPAPAGGQRSGSFWPHHRQRLQPRYLDAGYVSAPQTAAGRGCGWGEDEAASHCSSVRGEQRWMSKQENEVGWKSKEENEKCKERKAGEKYSKSKENYVNSENKVREHH